MKRRMLPILLCLMILLSGFAAADPFYEEWRNTGNLPALKDIMSDWTEAGITLTPEMAEDELLTDIVPGHFTTLTLVSGESPWIVPDREQTVLLGDPERVVPDLGRMEKILEFADENGLKIISPELIRPEETPAWFFRKDYITDAESDTVPTGILLKRMESYLGEIIRYCNTTHPGTVICWQVAGNILDPSQGNVNGFRMDNDWYRILGREYAEKAFLYADEAAEDQQTLYLTEEGITGNRRKKAIITLLRDLRGKVRIDGLGYRAVLEDESPTPKEITNALKQISGEVSGIRVTGLSIPGNDRSLAGELKRAARYRSVMGSLRQAVGQKKIRLDGIAFEAFGDNGLFTTDHEPRLALFGAIESDDIPRYVTDDTYQEFMLNMDEQERANQKRKELEIATMETLIKGLVKPLGENNPLMIQQFGADPWAMEYDGRIYIYMTGDEPVIGTDGQVKTNTYGNINTIRVISSADLVNWTDHGAIPAAGRNGAAKWATNSWAPAAAWKTINGQDKFFLYFADSGNGIGVLTADSPAGPFTDPIGKALVNRATPTCAAVTWLFDPAVLVDDDGSAYLYVGGGVPEGKQADPGTARVVALNDDMVSLNGDPVAICPPYLFEDSGINKFNGKYFYSYCTNFNVTPDATRQFGFDNGEIAYMISDDPMGPFTYKGGVLKNPEHFFGTGGNNHHCMFTFNGKTYITYHAATLEKKLGMSGKGYRSTFINELTLDPETDILYAKGTMQGVQPVAETDPYTRTEGVTVASLNAVEMIDADGSENGTGRAAKFAVDGITVVKNAAFGNAEGPQTLTVRYQAEQDAEIEFCIDPETDPRTVVQGSLKGGEGWQTAEIPFKDHVEGTHTVVIRIRGEKTLLDWWQISR